MTALATLLIALQMGCWAKVQSLRTARRSFIVKDDRFVKDGEPLSVRSGSVHYSRVPRAYWRDRLERARALGLNAVTTCVEINQCVGCTRQFFTKSFRGDGAAVLAPSSVENRHAIEQVSRRWRGGRRGDSARTRRKILISTQVRDTG